MKYLTKSFRLLFIYIVPILVIVYSVWYWSLNHKQLVDFYKNLNPYFYKVNDWATIFFTDKVKSQGNWWCLAGLVSSICFAFIVWKSKWPVFPKLTFNKKSFLIYACVSLAGMVLSVIANRHLLYATDEVFSALNFASLPSFQCLSYYILPNNHVLFNFINGSIFFWCNDLVLTGRLISMICYITVLCLSWYFLQKWIKNNWFRCLALFVLALQLPAWGFSGQARGYELLLLLSLLSFISFWEYWFEDKKNILPLHAFCNIAGMLTLPSYLYWWGGFLIAAFVFMIWEKRMDRSYLKISITSAFVMVLLFLPLFTFSGYSALANNNYVRPEDSNLWGFIKHTYEQGYFKGLFDEWFCFGTSTALIGVACILSPLWMFIYPTNCKKCRVLAVLYVSMVIAFIFLTVLMFRLPLYRNMIAHGYIIEMFILIVLISLAKSRILQIVFGLVLSSVIVFSAYSNFNRMPENLYYYNVNSYGKKLQETKTMFKTESTIYLDEECYYWRYIINSKFSDKEIRIVLNGQRFYKQDYCILPVGLLPPSDSTLYKIVERIDDFNIFEKK
jgi:hypothetical protein